MTQLRPAQDNPLDRIAVSLSGGGVRALGFHLGMLNMLDRLDLLENVRIISSVSGGSLAGIGYSLNQHLGRRYQDFFDDIYEFLPELNILEELLMDVTAEQPPSPSGRRDLICALANVYNKVYFKRYFLEQMAEQARDGEVEDDVTLGMLMNGKSKGHLEDMIFNSTEFKSGTAFRFQVSQFPCLVGNGNISICPKHAAMIRLADIMAASSCIPGGMEPLFYPDDFHWPEDDTWNRKRSKCGKREIKQEIAHSIKRNTEGKGDVDNFTLMDGGVYDNQGITSTLLALNRRQRWSQLEDKLEHGVPLDETDLETTGNEIIEDEEKAAGTCGCGASDHKRGDPPGPKEWANWMSGRQRHYNQRDTVYLDDDDLDLLIVSDTPVQRASFYPRILLDDQESQHEEFDKLSKAGHGDRSWLGNRTLGFTRKLGWVLLVALGLSLVFSVFEWRAVHNIADELKAGESQGWRTFISIAQYALTIFHVIVPILAMALIWAGLIFYKNRRTRAIKAMKDLIPNWNEEKPEKYIDKFRLGDVFRMGMLRAGSVAALTSSIFMNRIRGLGYATVFSRPDLQGRVMSNEIFSLIQEREDEDSFHQRLRMEGEKRGKSFWPPPEPIKNIARVASNLPTKLWVDEVENSHLNELDHLVICGQATTCYNLLKFLWDECRDDSMDDLADGPEGSVEIDANGLPRPRFHRAADVAWHMALDAWEQLCDDPENLLYDRYLNSRLEELNTKAKRREQALKVAKKPNRAAD